MKRAGTRLIIVLSLLLLAAVLPGPARAVQNFYGEGNVLIAVDMAPYAENEAVSYPENTMGTLVWGEEAKTGENTRPAFANKPYTVSPDVSVPEAPDYDPEVTYAVGQTVLFPYYREDDPDYVSEDWLTADAFPSEVFDWDGTPRFLIHSDCVNTEDALYYIPSEETEDGARHSCVDFLKIECVAVTEFSTVWQFTGTIYSNRTGFDPADYVGEIDLTDAELQYFRDTCDEAYTKQAELYGDPRWEDRMGDCDGKAAYVAMDLSVVAPNTDAFYYQLNTNLAGFDCLVMGVDRLPQRKTSTVQKEAEDVFTGYLIHELNHYIVSGCIGHEDERWCEWTGEAFAQAAVYTVKPESTAKLYYSPLISNHCSRLRMIPGMLWSDSLIGEYPGFLYIPYSLGPYFLRYIERETTGQADGRLWTEYFAQRTPKGSITGTELDGYLTKITGEGLEAWMAQFMAAVVVGADSGPYCMGEETVTAAYRVDPYVFFRPYEEYGTNLSFDGAADEGIKVQLWQDYGFSAAEGGGTTYAWRNDAGGKIAVTGADDRWYFYAVDMDLSDPDRVIEISSPAELAKIGRDKAYPLGGKYVLTADLDLKGGPDDPWTPIATDSDPFTGKFDGNGHAIRGLYVSNGKDNYQGLIGIISGDSEIRDLTVYGSVTGGECVGGIVGCIKDGTVCGCKSFVTVTGTKKCGGIAGKCSAGTIEDCTAAGMVTGGENVGGIVGSAEGCTVSACWQSGTVTGAEQVGGGAGQAQGGSILQNCYNAGTVSGESDTGGIAGRLEDSAAENCYSYQPGVPAFGGMDTDGDGKDTVTVTACYARSDTETGEGYLTTAAFQTTASFPGWDFETVWSLDNGVRPVLRDNMENVNPVPSGGGGGAAVTYSVTLPAAEANAASHGTVTSSAANARAGDKVTLTLTPDEGYQAAGVTVTDKSEKEVPVTKNADGTWSFTMPSTAVTITPEFEAVTEPDTLDNPDNSGGDVSDCFKDVPRDAWYHDAVQWAVDKGIMNGVSEPLFAPNDPCTRAMVVTMLWRMAGEPAANGSEFDDVNSDAWYADAVAWAASAGAVTGMTPDTFAPDVPVTREQLAAILYRCAQAQGKGFEGAWMFLLDYPDAADVSEWANEAMHWMVMHGVITGMGDGTLAPQDNATRAQIAAMFMRFCEEMAK